MNGSRPPLSPEVRALLAREREIPPLAAATRARSLARARAALAVGDAAASAPAHAAPPPRRVAAAALIIVASAAAGAAAYGIRARLMPPASPRPAPARVAVAAPPAAPSPPAIPAGDTAVAPEPAPAPAAAPHQSQADALRAELRLLRQARAAVAREDFAAALPPIAEHARRFKDGRLSEEREALRVKALAGLGRTAEARRAATAFEARFPRSVLLPAVKLSAAQP